MKVKDLAKVLEGLHPELHIILQKDAEGNGYSPLNDYTLGVYTSYNAWSGEFSQKFDDAEKTSISAICLVPFN